MYIYISLTCFCLFYKKKKKIYCWCDVNMKSNQSKIRYNKSSFWNSEERGFQMMGTVGWIFLWGGCTYEVFLMINSIKSLKILMFKYILCHSKVHSLCNALHLLPITYFLLLFSILNFVNGENTETLQYLRYILMFPIGNFICSFHCVRLKTSMYAGVGF